MNQHLSGLPAWLTQRLSAFYMAIYLFAAVVVLWRVAPLDHAQWRALFADGWVAAPTGLFFIALTLHAWVGMRDVILDYLGFSPRLRLAALGLVGVGLGLMGLWMLKILLGVWTL